MAIARSSPNRLSFSGVALADILANGVAIITIMIVVTLMTRHEQEQEKLEQAEDISVLLSREIASSFVMNSLPTSAPAVLHDYVRSPLDQNPNHARMPIIELRKDFIRNYYTGELYTRDELLRYQNGFDEYVRSLSKEQLLGMRIDVYNISQFYLAMSILKAHNHRPRHWHFLNRPKDDAQGEGEASALSQIFKNQKEYDDANWKKALGGDASIRQEARRALPEDIELAQGRQQAGRLNRMPFGRGGHRAKTWQEVVGLPPVNADEAQGIGIGPSGGKGKRPNEKQRRKSKVFRAATDDAPNALIGLPPGDKNLDLHKLVQAYFDYMSRVQVAVDQGLSGLGRPFNFKWDILAQLSQLTPPKDVSLRGLFDNLAYWLSTPIYNEDPSLRVVVVADTGVTDGALSGQHITLPVNTPIQQAEWLRDANQPSLPENLPDFMQMQIQVSLYPDLYRGIDLPVAQDMIIMMPPPEAVPDPEFRWRIVTLVNAEVNDIVTGFVYAALAETDTFEADASEASASVPGLTLILPVDENAIALDYLRLTASFQHPITLSETWQIIFYTLLVVIFFLAALHRYRRPA